MAIPTAQDQYMLELLNRARLNPQAEANRYPLLTGDLNEGLPVGTISTTAKQPLAFNLNLFNSAKSHSQWMLDYDILSHVEGVNGTPVGTGATLANRASIAGYSGTTLGENIAWRGTTGTIDWTTTVGQQHEDLFVDTGIVGRGHRTNMMYDNFREIGISSIVGTFTLNGTNYDSVVTTQNFGRDSGTTAFLTGVAYTDRVTNDDFYTVGEGLGNMTVNAVGNGQTFSTTTLTSGGYGLRLAAGTYSVTFSGDFNNDGVVDTSTARTVTIGSQNIKQDFTSDTEATNGNDVLLGNVNADILDGKGGNDTISGGAGLDILLGQAGDDILNGEDGNDTLLGGGGIDTLNGGNGTDVMYGEDGNDTLTGGNDNDFLFGQAGNDTISGDAGNDYLFGGIGLDILNGGTGVDEIYGEDDNDTIRGGDDNDFLFGQLGDDTIYGDAGNDYITGGDGIDTLFGGDGIDQLNGESGNDILHGENGDDALYGNDGIDYLLGGSGNDFLDGGIGDDLLSGGAGNDVLIGGDGNDTLSGDELLSLVAGVDYLYGGNGNDILYGYAGSDFLIGGAGSDKFAYAKMTDAGDIITDFTAGVGGDNLDLTPLFNSILGVGHSIGAVNTSYLKFVQSGTNTICQVDSSGTGSAFVTMATLNSVTASQLSVGFNVFV
jgi:serralysin